MFDRRFRQCLDVRAGVSWMGSVQFFGALGSAPREDITMSMWKRSLGCVLAAALILGGFTGCANWESKHTWGVVIGGAAGAGAGAGIGSTMGSWAWGGAIGLVAGAVIGYVVADLLVDSHPTKAGHRGTFGDTQARARREAADMEFRRGMASDDPRSAVVHFENSAELFPSSEAWNNAGLCHVRLGERETARAEFGKALELDQSFAPAQRNLELLNAK